MQNGKETGEELIKIFARFKPSESTSQHIEFSPQNVSTVISNLKSKKRFRKAPFFF